MKTRNVLVTGALALGVAAPVLAQSVVGVVAGRAMARLERSLRSIGNGARLCIQRHDSCLVSHSAHDMGRVREALAEAFYSPINAHGRTLNIPIEVKLGQGNYK